jgi:tetratricopeptide (TPR) repeat protein
MTKTTLEYKKKIIKEASNLVSDNRQDEAIKIIDNYFFHIDSNDLDLLILKGNIFETLAEPIRAIAIYKKALKIDPHNSAILIDLGDSYSANTQRDYQTAVKYYDKALKIVEKGKYYYDKEDEFVEACIGKANALIELKKPMVALKSIIHGLHKYPKNVLLGSVLQRAQETFSALDNSRVKQKKRTRLKILDGGKANTQDKHNTKGNRVRFVS